MNRNGVLVYLGNSSYSVCPSVPKHTLSRKRNCFEASGIITFALLGSEVAPETSEVYIIYSFPKFQQLRKLVATFSFANSQSLCFKLHAYENASSLRSKALENPKSFGSYETRRGIQRFPSSCFTNINSNWSGRCQRFGTREVLGINRGSWG